MASQPVPKRGGKSPPCSSLWQRAWDSLDREMKDGLSLGASSSNIVDTVLRTVNEKKVVCIQKRWKVRKSNGEEIIVRDMLDKILYWANKFKAVGDVAIQYDPIHCSLPWAGVRFILQLAIGEKEVFGGIVEGLEIISQFITRYTLLEILYIGPNTGARNELERALLSLYREVLIYLLKAKRYFQTSTTKRMLKSAFDMSENHQMNEIKVQEKRVTDLKTLADAEDIKTTQENITALQLLLVTLEEPILRVADQTAAVMRNLEKSQHCRMTRWVSPVPFMEHHRVHSSKRIPGCGKWFTNHPQYRKWMLASSSSILVLHGIQGSGKTSLAAIAVQSFLQGNSGNSGSMGAPLAYFYCARNSFEASRSDPDEVMRSILRQLAFGQGSARNVHDIVVTDYERREAEAGLNGSDIPRLSIPDCVELILGLAQSNPATIVVDALDEIQESRWHELIQAFEQIVKRSASVVKVLITCRDQLVRLTPDGPKVRIQSSECQDDMIIFVRHHVKAAIQTRRLLGGSVTESLQEEIIRTLVQGAKEMFIWVVLQIDNLCQMRLETDVRAAMTKLPSDTVENLYATTFRKIMRGGSAAHKMAIRVFSWLLCLQEPLSPTAFTTALMMANPKDHEEVLPTLSEILDICFNLVTLDSELNILRFAHVSVQEFLETNETFSPTKNHSFAAICCLNICENFSPSDVGAPLNVQKDFYQYAVLYFPEHIRLAKIEDSKDELSQALEEFVFCNGEPNLAFIIWVDEVKQLSKTMHRGHPLKAAMSAVPNPDYSPLHMACRFCIPSLIEELSKTPAFDWNQKNDDGQTGIYLAAAVGHESLIDKLVHLGAHVNEAGGKFGNPLQAACFAGHNGVVKKLLNNGAEPQSAGLFECAFTAACMGNHQEIAKLLLNHAMVISAQDEYDRVLRLAAEAGFVDIIRHLRQNHSAALGASLSGQTHALEAAIIKGQEGVVLRFLQGPQLMDIIPDHAISVAALSGGNKIIQLLLARGFSIDEEGPFGSPLRTACLMGHISTVQLLLDADADVNLCGSFGDALQAASMKGHVQLAKMLIQAGIKTHNKGGLYGNAFRAAAYNGHQQVLEILVDACASRFDEGIRDAFHAAAEAGFEDIVNYLIEKGCERPPEPLFRVYHRRCSPKYKRLLNNPSAPMMNMFDSATTVHTGIGDRIQNASFSEYEVALHYIHGKSVSDPEPISRNGWGPNEAKSEMPLVLASSRMNESVARILTTHHHRIDNCEHKIRNVFQKAAVGGQNEVMRLFLDSCFDMTRYLHEGIKMAAFHGHLTTVDMLLAPIRNKALMPNSPIEDQNAHVGYILIGGCSGGHEAMVSLGLSMVNQDFVAAEISAQQYSEQTRCQAPYGPYTSFIRAQLRDGLRAAVSSGHLSLARYLIENDQHKLLAGDYSEDLSRAARDGRYSLVEFFVSPPVWCENISAAVTRLAVLDASVEGNTGTINLLLQNITQDGSYLVLLSEALRIACFQGHSQLVEYLIAVGADINALISMPYTPYYDSLMYCPDFASRPNPINALQASLIWFETPRMFYDYQRAAAQEETIRLLLNNSVNPNDLGGHTAYPINIASVLCSPALVQLLIEKGADVNLAIAGSPTPIHAAASREIDATAVVTLLLEAGVVLPEDAEGEEFIAQTALKFFEERMDAGGLSEGAFENSRSVSQVLSQGPGGVVQLLLQQFPQVKATRREYGLLLQMAAVEDDRQCIDLLLQRQVNLNTVGYYYGSALQASAHKGNVSTVYTLLAAGANPNLVGGQHGTALRAAVVGGHADLVDILIDHEADINLPHFPPTDRPYPTNSKIDSRPILVIACDVGNVQIIARLLSAGANVNVHSPGKTKEEYATPLHMACARGSIPVIRLLMYHGANLNCQAHATCTPLGIASREGNLEAVQLLLDAGAELNSGEETSALEEAAYQGHQSIFLELLNAGALEKESVESLESVMCAALQSNAKDSNIWIIELLLDQLAGNEHEESIRKYALDFGPEDSRISDMLVDGIKGTTSILSNLSAAGHLDTVKSL